jgi:hypothetical protein
MNKIFNARSIVLIKVTMHIKCIELQMYSKYLSKLSISKLPMIDCSSDMRFELIKQVVRGLVNDS